jgi:hypothetical protein
MSKYPIFDVSQLNLEDSSGRPSKLRAADLLQVQDVPEQPTDYNPAVMNLADDIARAHACDQPVIFFIGGHVIKAGCSLYLREFIKNGWVQHIACNGAVLIHDFELSIIGKTSEWVADTITDGRFGMWQNLKSLNIMAGLAVSGYQGYGEAIGENLSEQFADNSVFAAAYEHDVPMTVHPLIGGDINHMFAGNYGAKIGEAGYTDFLIFTQSLYRLQKRGGVFVCFGSAVHGPEVYLKSLSMVRNVLLQEGAKLHPFTTAVCDLYPLPESWRDGEASEDDPAYYYRPWKTILLRSLMDGGQSHYIRGNHRDVIPELHRCITWRRKIQFGET